ncbi:DUF4747 family protein [Massilia timonae]|uniref:DUF4747 family protein n=1 Tax=Massilia timonae TaxID=47229 RepID=A0A1S2NDJ5_9BURK|nr:DUF4747 family protein [Massilia timonae]OIJ43128.1 hypothetical protein LO55_4301 [Massilia timonae]
MAKFRVYNVQLLPLEETTQEVGIRGYKTLFSKFQSHNKRIIKERKEGRYHFRQSEDIFIGPVSDFTFPRGFVYGEFVRYRKVEQVKELGTKRSLFTAGPRTGVTSEERIAFVFDAQNHLLAIEAPAWLPPSKAFADALANMLSPIAEQDFPGYELTIHGLSKKSGLNKVFSSATAYSVIDLDLTFRNGHDTEELLQELKDTRTKSLTVHASAGKGGRMNRLPHFVKAMVVAAATGLGGARITYFAPQQVGNRIVERQQVYDTRDMPVTFQVNRTQAATGDAMEFYDRIRGKLSDIHDDLDDEEEA